MRDDCIELYPQDYKQLPLAIESTVMTDFSASLPHASVVPPVSIQEAQQRVDHWINSIGVRYFNELTNLAQLVEEVGELARIISRKFGEQSFKDGEESKCVLADEMADVLFVLICLANQTGIDLAAAFEKNLDKKTCRDQNRHINNAKLLDRSPTQE